MRRVNSLLTSTFLLLSALIVNVAQTERKQHFSRARDEHVFARARAKAALPVVSFRGRKSPYPNPDQPIQVTETVDYGEAVTKSGLNNMIWSLARVLRRTAIKKPENSKVALILPRLGGDLPSRSDTGGKLHEIGEVSRWQRLLE
eukprot:scaffold25231_cov34-Prasinocladus_malaysianus.AAC.6